MWKYFFILSLIGCCSCSNGAMEAEEAHIRSKILLHNNSFGLKYIIDSINKKTELTAWALWGGRPAAIAEEYSDSLMMKIYKNQNLPYHLDLDAHLTFQKFMSFCEKNNLDPIKTANSLQ